MPRLRSGAARCYCGLCMSSISMLKRCLLTSPPSNRVVGLFDLLMRSLLLPVFMPTPRDVTQINIVIIPIAISFSFSLRHMTLESPYQCIAQGHMASSLQALYKARPSKIVAARDLYRIYATSPLESSRASQSARRAIIYSVTIMLVRILMIPSEQVTEHLLGKTDIYQVVAMSLSTVFALAIIASLFQLMDYNRWGQRHYLLSRILMIQAFVLIVPLNLNLDSMRFVRFCMQILLSTGLSAVATVYAVEILPYRCRGMDAQFKCCSLLKGFNPGNKKTTHH